MPLTWKQVKKGLDPQRYSLRTVPSFLAKSVAWKEYCSSEGSLSAAIKRIYKMKRASKTHS